MVFDSFSIDVAEGCRDQVESSGKDVCVLEEVYSYLSKNRDGRQLVSSVADEYV